MILVYLEIGALVLVVLAIMLCAFAILNQLGWLP